MHLEVSSRSPTSNPQPTTLLFVHGAWHGAWCWEEHFLDYFATRGYPTSALDLRGHGRSDGRERLRWHRIADYVEDVKRVADELPSPPILIGHSMGGAVVQKYLEQHAAPGAVLLASVPAAGVLRATLRYAQRHPIAFLKGNLTLSLYPFVASAALARDAFFSESMPAELVQNYFARIQDESYLAFLDMMLFNLPRPERVGVPMLVLGAANDALFLPSEIEATARAYRAEAVIFPDMAHDMMLEAGWEGVAERIATWLGELGV